MKILGRLSKEGYMEKIIKNSIKCNHCGDILVSYYTHDFKCCSCGCVAIDGGYDYRRRCFKNSTDYTELSIVEEVPNLLGEFPRKSKI